MGQTLGGYRVLDQLSKDDSGVTYLAEQIHIRQRVVIRVLDPRLSRSPQFVAQFRKSAQMAAAVTSGHVRAIHELDQTEDGALYVVLEHLEGRSLADIIASESPLSLARATQLALDIGEGIEASHRVGVIPQEISPRNIIVTSEPEVAKLLEVTALAAAGEVHGIRTAETTGRYIAPELDGDTGAVTVPANVYSFGVVVYELLTGRSVEAAQLAAPPRSPAAVRPEVPQALAELVMRTLAPQPDQRPGLVDVVLELRELRTRFWGHVPRAGGTPTRGTAIAVSASEDQTLIDARIAIPSLGPELARATAVSPPAVSPPAPPSIPAVSATTGLRPAWLTWPIGVGLGAILIAGGIIFAVWLHRGGPASGPRAPLPSVRSPITPPERPAVPASGPGVLETRPGGGAVSGPAPIAEAQSRSSRARAEPPAGTSQDGGSRPPNTAMIPPSARQPDRPVPPGAPGEASLPVRPKAPATPAERNEAARRSVNQALHDLGFKKVKAFVTSGGVIELRGHVADSVAHDAVVAIARRVAPRHEIDVNLTRERD